VRPPRTPRRALPSGPESGQAMVETAIAFPLLLLVAIGLVQFALYTHAQHVVLAAVQEGARVAAAGDRTIGDGAAYAETILRAGLGQGAAGIAVRAVDGGDAVAVEATGGLRLILPWAADATLPLDARAVVAKERFRPGGSAGG
jgi:hypothetical protein